MIIKPKISRSKEVRKNFEIGIKRNYSYEKAVLKKDLEGFKNEFFLGARKLVRAKIYTNNLP